MESLSARRHGRRGAAKTSPAPDITPVSDPVIDAPAIEATPGVELEPVIEHEPVVPLATPEREFAARVPPPAPEPPCPTTRRAIFYDVENASQPVHIARVIEHLALDRVGRRTELVAVGNWRVIGHDTARLLARHGAQLVHSAPSTGVKDWSDLRIAVSAGVWLAGARPGDVLEIVSDDRAFDAVGDVAAALGIAFRRLSYRTLTGTPHELVQVVRELAQHSPNGAVLLDTVARALKARGFSRPPGSPRLVTRLRRIKELSVSPTGMIALEEGAAALPEPIPAAAGEGREPEPATRRRRRRGRRGGRGRRRPGTAVA